MWKGLRTALLSSEKEESTQERKAHSGNATPQHAMRRCSHHFSDVSLALSVTRGLIIKIIVKITVIYQTLGMFQALYQAL